MAVCIMAYQLYRLIIGAFLFILLFVQLAKKMYFTSHVFLSLQVVIYSCLYQETAINLVVYSINRLLNCVIINFVWFQLDLLPIMAFSRYSYRGISYYCEKFNFLRTWNSVARYGVYFETHWVQIHLKGSHDNEMNEVVVKSTVCQVIVFDSLFFFFSIYIIVAYGS